MTDYDSDYDATASYDSDYVATSSYDSDHDATSSHDSSDSDDDDWKVRCNMIRWQ